MSSKPTILFIHGGWHELEIHNTFFEKLRGEGYDVIAPGLPSKGNETPLDPPGADIQLVSEVAKQLCDEGKEFTVVSHSYGSLVAVSALVGLGLETRQKQGLQGGAKRIFYVAGFMLEKGKCLEDYAPAVVLGWCTYKDDLKVFVPGVDAGHIFYAEIDREDQIEQAALGPAVVKHPKACSFYKPTLRAAYDDIPSIFVYTLHDQAFPYIGQKALVAAHRADGVTIAEESLPSGHFPSLSMPEKLVDIVLKYE